MVRYSCKEAAVPEKTAKARGNQLRTHFKKTREVGFAIKGQNLKRAQKFLQDVLEMKQAVPFTRFTGGCGRHAQGKNLKAAGSQVGWPQKSTKYMLDLLKNVEANAEMKGLEVDNLYITHMQVNRAQQMRRRTYRAHGRINPYMANPCHIELCVTEKSEGVKKGEDDENTQQLRVSRKRLAQMRFKKIQAGGGI